MKTIGFIALILSSLLLGQRAVAQEIMLDEMVEAGELKLFPVQGNPSKFYYLPDKIEIGDGPNGKKQFSFLKFVDDAPGNGEGGIQKVDGGGLVTFTINFAVSDQMVNAAQTELQRKVPGAVIHGPLNYRSGTFALVSEFQQEDGDWTKRVLGLGKAPIMEGHKAAVSIRLTATGATILWESFQQAASNINVSFEMLIAGYRNPYEAKMTAWWEKIASNKALNIGLRTDYLGMDIQDIMKELKESGAIELEVKGENAKMDRLWEMAYGKLTAQMFEPSNDPITLATLQDDPNAFSNFDRADKFNADVRKRIEDEYQAEVARVKSIQASYQKMSQYWPWMADLANEDVHIDKPDGKRPVTGDKPTGAIPKIPEVNRKTPPSFALLASYRKKKFKKTGFFTLSFKRWMPDTQAMRFDENIGAFGKRMLDDPDHFRIISLADPAYKIREVLVQLDGQNAEDFNKFVNFVTVSIRKTHQDGTEHFDELKIDRSTFSQTSNNFSMTYGYHGDTDRLEWKNYEYRVHWNLFGGAEWTSDWVQTDDFMIPVTPPHRYREINIEADPSALTDSNVRLARVKVKTQLFGKTETTEVNLRPSAQNSLFQTIRYAHEPNATNYEYEIDWLKRGGKRLSTGPQTGEFEYIFADELPPLDQP